LTQTPLPLVSGVDVHPWQGKEQVLPRTGVGHSAFAQALGFILKAVSSKAY